MNDFYALISQLSGQISMPLMNIFYSTNIPIIGAIILGIVGSMAPCQISANIGAITYFTPKILARETKGEMVFYLLGRIFVYSVLGAIVTFIGQNLAQDMIPLFSWSKKLLAPLLLVTGVFMIGLIPVRFFHKLFQNTFIVRLPERLTGKSKAFWMGVVFSLGFCPTMFWLFFGLLIPLAQTSTIGITYPVLFSIGTVLPLLFFLFILDGNKISGAYIKAIKKWGRRIQMFMGLLLVIVGVIDFLLFW